MHKPFAVVAFFAAILGIALTVPSLANIKRNSIEERVKTVEHKFEVWKCGAELVVSRSKELGNDEFIRRYGFAVPATFKYECGEPIEDVKSPWEWYKTEFRYLFDIKD